MREQQRGQLFIHVAQALGVIHNHRAIPLCHAKNLGGVQVSGIHRRIGAHQHHLAGAEFQWLPIATLEVRALFIAHGQRRHRGHRAGLAHAQSAGADVVQAMAAALGFQQHGEGGVLGGLDGLDRVHHHHDIKGCARRHRAA